MLFRWAAAAITNALIGVVVVGWLCNHRRCSVGELHDGRHGQQMLVKSGVEEDAVFADRSAERRAKLLLAIVRLTGGIGLLGVEIAVAQIVEAAAVPLVGTRLGDHVKHRAAGPSSSAL